MKKLFLGLFVAIPLALLLLPAVASAATGGDALAGLQAVLKSMIEAYVEYLKALA